MVVNSFMVLTLLWTFRFYSEINGQRYLTRNGNKLILNKEKVFLSGMNQAWVHYAYDFGNGEYRKSKATLYKTLSNIHGSGGNSMRVWLHVSGQNSPQFDANGYVTGPGTSVIADLRDFLEEAQRKDVLVTICLWNGAVEPSEVLRGLIQDDDKLTSYIDHALSPMVRQLANLRSLGSWEIINEPEGTVATGVSHAERCYDTSDVFRWFFADWTGGNILLQKVLRFIGRQVDAVHRADTKALATVGIWTYQSMATSLYKTNYFSDKCLQLASGVDRSGLDYYEIHSYDLRLTDTYLTYAPFKVNASFYGATKPVVIGEFSSRRGAGMSSPRQFLWAYSRGYSGAWSWSAIGGDRSSDSVTVQDRGMGKLKDRNNQTLGGRVDIDLNNIVT